MHFELSLPIYKESEFSTTCPWANPELFSSYDTDGAEIEALEALAALVRVIKPQFILETGTYLGRSATYMAEALKRNGRGRIVSLELNPDLAGQAAAALATRGLLGNGLGQCHVVIGPSLEYVPPEPIDLLFSDSDFSSRLKEIERFRQHLAPRAWVAIHDWMKHRGSIGEIDHLGWIERVDLPTPRGLTIGRLK